MSRCTCSTDKEVTCIVHPTDRSLKDRIQKLENRVEKWKRYWDEADRRGDSLEAQLAAERADAERYRWFRDECDDWALFQGYVECEKEGLNAAIDTARKQATAPEPVAWEYYYKTKGCSAKNAHDPDCICWHKEGTGPYDNERHDSTSSPVIWRPAYLAPPAAGSGAMSREQDREMLEKAAMAAGYIVEPADDWLYRTDDGAPYYWNPLKSDADAFRLMVDCGIDVEYIDASVEASVWTVFGHPRCLRAIETDSTDKHAATRRAIVRAAAAMSEGQE